MFGDSGTGRSSYLAGQWTQAARLALQGPAYDQY